MKRDCGFHGFGEGQANVSGQQVSGRRPSGLGETAQTANRGGRDATSASDRLLTAQQVAEWLNVRTAWVQEMARSGQLPAIKLGKYWRFSRDSIASWIEANEIPAGQDRD